MQTTTFNRGLSPLKKALEEVEPLTVGYFLIDIGSKKVWLSERSRSLLQIKKTTLSDTAELIDLLAIEDDHPLQLFFQKAVRGNFAGGSIRFQLKAREGLPQWIRCSVGQRKELLAAPYLLGVFKDITQEYCNKLLVESCLDGTFIGDLKKNDATFSGKIFDLLLMKSGYYPNATSIYNNIIYSADQEFHKRYTQELVKKASAYNRMEYRVYGKDLEPIWISNRNKIFYDENDKPILIVGGYINIQNLRYYHRFVQTAFETSRQTGLANRYKLVKDFEEIALCKKEWGHVLFINIDYFDRFNQTFGYEKQEYLLKDAAEMLTQLSPDTRFLYHLLGNTFIQLLPRYGAEQTMEQMELYRNRIPKRFHIQETDYSYSVSTVAIPYSTKTISPEVLLKRGDIAIQAALRRGSGSALLFQEKHFKKHDQTLSLENSLRLSVFRGMCAFSIQYQPFVDHKSNRYIGAEALLRWNDGQGVAISTSLLIALLEKIGLIQQVGDWVLEQAFAQCREWIDHGFASDFFVSINVSAAQLAEKSFADRVLKQLEAISLPAHNVVIEVTENALMSDFQRGMKPLNQLKASGVRLAVDNFGTGYSSLSYLKILPIDQVRVDRSFVHGIETSDYQKEFIASIINITKSIGRSVYLEGVEKASQADILGTLNADAFQGFFFGKPQDPKELEENYKKQGGKWQRTE